MPDQSREYERYRGGFANFSVATEYVSNRLKAGFVTALQWDNVHAFEIIWVVGFHITTTGV